MSPAAEAFQQNLLKPIERRGLRPGDHGDAVAFAKQAALRLVAEKNGAPVETLR